MTAPIIVSFKLTDEFDKVVRRFEAFDTVAEVDETVARLQKKYETVEYTIDQEHTVPPIQTGYNYHTGAIYADCRSIDYHHCDKCGAHIGGKIYPSND